MATGTQNKLTGQVGEHLVSAVLGMKGYYASPYSGNVPGFDITAVDAESLKSFPIQVKASTGGALMQGTISKWADIEVKNGVQRLLGKKRLKHPEMIWIFVQVGQTLGTSRFFICTEQDVQNKQVEGYEAWMEAKGWKRPRNPESLHSCLNVVDFEEFEDNWSLLEQAIGKD